VYSPQDGGRGAVQALEEMSLDSLQFGSSQRDGASIKKILSRLSLVVLLTLLSMPVVLPPTGAIEPLWEEAADLRAIKSYAAAVEVYEQIAALTPETPEALLAIGEIYLTQHRWPLAEDAFNRALVRDGENVEALAGLATARWEQGDRQRAVSLWESALAHWPDGGNRSEIEPNLSNIRVRLALAYLDMNRPADAEAILHHEVADSDNPTAHLYLAMMQAINDPASARRELEAITDNEPPAVMAGRDYLFDALDRAEAADTEAGEAKSIGLALVQLGEWQLARLALEQALLLDPTDAETMAFLGYTEAQLGRPAFAYSVAAIESKPDWPLGHYLLGLYYLKQEAYEFAAEEFRTTLRLDPGNAQAMADLAHAYVGLGQYLDAEEALVEATRSEPDDLSFHSSLVSFYADHAFQVTDRGLAAARTAADLAPEDPQIRDMLGWMYFLAGDSSQARLHLESALRLNPELASTYYHLGVLRKATGEEEAAQFAFLRAIDLDTGGFYRSQAQKALRDMAQVRQ
jgi:tetratricopeptide (TPR) repeat protein